MKNLQFSPNTTCGTCNDRSPCSKYPCAHIGLDGTIYPISGSIPVDQYYAYEAPCSWTIQVSGIANNTCHCRYCDSINDNYTLPNDHLRNIIKLDFGITPENNYRATVIIANQISGYKEFGSSSNNWDCRNLNFYCDNIYTTFGQCNVNLASIFVSGSMSPFRVVDTKRYQNDLYRDGVSYLTYDPFRGVSLVDHWNHWPCYSSILGTLGHCQTVTSNDITWVDLCGNIRSGRNEHTLSRMLFASCEKIEINGVTSIHANKSISDLVLSDCQECELLNGTFIVASGGFSTIFPVCCECSSNTCVSQIEVELAHPSSYMYFYGNSPLRELGRLSANTPENICHLSPLLFSFDRMPSGADLINSCNYSGVTANFYFNRLPIGHDRPCSQQFNRNYGDLINNRFLLDDLQQVSVYVTIGDWTPPTDPFCIYSGYVPKPPVGSFVLELPTNNSIDMNTCSDPCFAGTYSCEELFRYTDQVSCSSGCYGGTPLGYTIDAYNGDLGYPNTLTVRISTSFNSFYGINPICDIHRFYFTGSQPSNWCDSTQTLYLDYSRLPYCGWRPIIDNIDVEVVYDEL